MNTVGSFRCYKALTCEPGYALKDGECTGEEGRRDAPPLALGPLLMRETGCTSKWGCVEGGLKPGGSLRWGSKEAPCGGDLRGILTWGHGVPGRENRKCEAFQERRDLCLVKEWKVSGWPLGSECGRMGAGFTGPLKEGVESASQVMGSRFFFVK